MPAAMLLPLLFWVPVLLALLPRTTDAQTLRGSRASVDRIHSQAVQHGLKFYETPAQVRSAVAQGTLVRLAGNADYQVHNVSYPYVLPEVHTFVTRLASQYRGACGEKLVVTSATRPQSLRLINSVDKSVHPTGMAIDLRKPTRARCLTWLRTTLLALESSGILEAVEEHRPPHFHVAVFPRPYERYVQSRGGNLTVAARTESRPAANNTTARTSASSNSSSGSGGGTTYRVRRGDSLWSIAQRHGLQVDELKRANGIKSPRIVAGQTLIIPTAR